MSSAQGNGSTGLGDLTTAASFGTLISGVMVLLIVGVQRLARTIREIRATSYAKIPTSTDEILINLQRAFLNIKGHKKNKESVIRSILGWRERKNAEGTKYPGSLVLHFAGTSGSGKSLMADAIARGLSHNNPPIRVSASSVTKGSGLTVAEQLFLPQVIDSPSAPYGKITNYPPLYNQLIRNQNCVVQIDEFEKLVEIDNTLIPLLWDVVDCGKIYAKNDFFIQCENTIFILTSNMSKESLGDNAEVIVDQDKQIKEDSSLLNKIWDQSFLNRIKTFYFDSLGEIEYMEIFRERFGMALDYYQKSFNIHIDMKEDIINHVAKKTAQYKSGGARNVDFVMNEFFTEMSRFKRENNITGLLSKPLNLVLKLEGDGFKVSRIS
ncbi:MAG: AAA family ATPase [Candidatus Improbicoccus pseudotrichonymphae]|uniref:AAA family ATPase n=1 Tax=Candidatus Improbicoccus pseudotrichonymphae TaxID=3033792 RepID=A0AA48L0Y3_9FIRM|nr:MAG: AAA family ATPase [Candidatus Improbicoccus pseudotrichonymphae]